MRFRSRTPLTVLVCGSRGYIHQGPVDAVLDRLARRHVLTIISGMARGADSLAVDWARRHQVALLEFPADWDRFGRSAGFKRNTQMLVEGRPDLVVAFTDRPLEQSRGTYMMTRIASEAGVPVEHHQH